MVRIAGLKALVVSVVGLAATSAVASTLVLPGLAEATAAPVPQVASAEDLSARDATPSSRDATRAELLIAEQRQSTLDLQGAAIDAEEQRIRAEREAQRQAEERARAEREAFIAENGYDPGVTDPREIGRQMAASTYGWGADQFACYDAIIMKESRWNPRADNPTSSAYGIPQALPGKKMASAGADWETNPATQIRWGLGYVRDVYGTPCQALAFRRVHNWY